MKALNNISIRLRFSFLLGPLEWDSTVVQSFYLLKRRSRWTDGPTDGQTDLCTDLRMYRPSYRDARTHLQTTWIKMNEWGAAAKAFKEANPLLSAVSGIFDKNKVDRQPSDAFFILPRISTGYVGLSIGPSVSSSISRLVHLLVTHFVSKMNKNELQKLQNTHEDASLYPRLLVIHFLHSSCSKNRSFKMFTMYSGGCTNFLSFKQGW